MNQAVIGVGSNIRPRRNVGAAVAALRQAFGPAACSRWEWTQAIGRPGQPDYLNGALRIRTRLDRAALSAWLKQLEDRLGRVRTADKFARRTIDLDLVVWNGRIVHADVYQRDFLARAIEETADLAVDEH